HVRHVGREPRPVRGARRQHVGVRALRGGRRHREHCGRSVRRAVSGRRVAAQLVRRQPARQALLAQGVHADDAPALARGLELEFWRLLPHEAHVVGGEL
ncbi:hypothetical protein PybrP1_003366, partial [[Pythium] brassicae (nom. inval.)]